MLKECLNTSTDDLDTWTETVLPYFDSAAVPDTPKKPYFDSDSPTFFASPPPTTEKNENWMELLDN